MDIATFPEVRIVFTAFVLPSFYDLVHYFNVNVCGCVPNRTNYIRHGRDRVCVSDTILHFSVQKNAFRPA
jgi:23S rRNA A1618 N6-methylase RlmF